MNVLFKVEITNGINRDSKIYESLIIQTDTSKSLWSESRLMRMGFKCEEAISANDCSSTHDFSHAFMSRAVHGGYYPRELVPSAYYENNDSTIDPRCLVFGTSDVGISSTQCFHCMSVYEKNLGSFTYQSNDYNHCVVEPDLDKYPQLENCLFFTNGYSFEAACNKCKDGYSLNFVYPQNQKNSINCVPDAECTSSSLGSYFISKTYHSGKTNQFCLSCPINCARCDDNLKCIGCHPEYATFDSATQTCTCLVANCNNCTQTHCDICDGLTIHHISRDGTHTCQLTTDLETHGCISGYGPDPSITLPSTFTAICKQCANPFCETCTEDYLICKDCPGDKVPFTLIEHPLTPSNVKSCINKNTSFDYYFYNSKIGSFQRCETNPNHNCLRCSDFGVCLKYVANATEPTQPPEPTDYSPETIETVEIAGKITGQAQSIAEKSSFSLAILAVLFNIRFSESLIKAIQIIVLFDKLRLVNVNFKGGLLGYFLEKVYSAFDSNMVKTNDYIHTARPGDNKFKELKVQVIAYRRKVDKFIIFTLNIIVELALYWKWKQLDKAIEKYQQTKAVLTIQSTKALKVHKVKITKLGLRIRTLDYISFVVTIVCMLDILFYSCHQLLHQRSKIILKGFHEYTVTYFWSLGLVIVCLYLFIRAITRVLSLTNRELQNHVKLHNVTNNKEQKVSPSQNDKDEVKDYFNGSNEIISDEKAFINSESSKIKRKIKRSQIQQAQDEQSRITLSEEKLNLNNSMNIWTNISLVRTKRDLRSYIQLKVKKNKKSQKKYKCRNKHHPFRSPSKNLKYRLKNSLDIKLTLRKILMGEHYFDYTLSHVNYSQIEILPKIYQFLFILKILIFCTPILVFQNMPIIQTLTMAIVELAFIILIIYLRIKKGVPNSGFYFWASMIESLFIFNYMVFAMLKINHPNHQKMPKGLKYYELVVLLLLLFIIIQQLLKIIGEVVFYSIQWLKSKTLKPSSKQKQIDAPMSLEQKSEKPEEAGYFDNDYESRIKMSKKILIYKCQGNRPLDSQSFRDQTKIKKLGRI